MEVFGQGFSLRISDGRYNSIAEEVLSEALTQAAKQYAARAAAAALAVTFDERGSVVSSTMSSLDAWHEATLRHEHALALLGSACRADTSVSTRPSSVDLLPGEGA
ncbi:hypothetical protein GCM10027579_13470 [Calidifontibacter terrae]